MNHLNEIPYNFALPGFGSKPAVITRIIEALLGALRIGAGSISG